MFCAMYYYMNDIFIIILLKANISTNFKLFKFGSEMMIIVFAFLLLLYLNLNCLAGRWREL